MRKEGFNKIGAWLIVTMICMLAVMLVTVGMPTAVYAAEDTVNFAGGDGSVGNPYKVETAAHLNNVCNKMSSGVYFEQTADIDLLSVGNWEPIGTYDNPFTGNFDGKGHTIRNLAINRPSGNDQGLFGVISGGGNLKDLHIEGANVTGGVNIGILAGIIGDANGTSGNGTIENCSTSGTVNGSARIGGLIGSVQHEGAVVTESFSTAEVTAAGTSYNGSAGGLAGFLISGGTIRDSYATGTVHGYYAGGLVGDMNDAESTIERSYAAGAVTGSNKSGGLVGNKGTGTVNNSFFDSVATGQSGSAGGTAKNTDKMQQQSTFTNWDFSSIWDISQGATYPFLRWQDTFALTYDLNGGTGTLPAACDVPAGAPFTTADTGSLTVPQGMQLKEWNTNADGTGTGYAAGATVTMPAKDLPLYAIWEVRIIIDTPDTVIFGTPFAITVRVVDIYGDPVTDYTGTIVFKGDGNQLGLPDTYTFTESDNGVKTFSHVVVNSFGPFTLSVFEQSNQPDYYWEFDEGTGTTTVDSVNGTSGTLYNTDSGVWASGTPKTNFTNPYALKLDGSNDYINVGTVDLAHQSFTIAFWTKRFRGEQEWIISQGTGDPNQGLHIGFRSDSEFSFAFWGDDLNITGLSYDTDWHHWTLTYNAATKTQKVFQDGNLLNTRQAASDLISSGSLLIGKRFDGYYHYGGSIDDLRVYQRALSPTEIETLADGNRSFLIANKVINVDASDLIPSLQLNIPQIVKAGEAFAAEVTALDSEGKIINSINGPVSIDWRWDAGASPNGSSPILAAGRAIFSNGVAYVDGFIPYEAGETIVLTAEIAGTDARRSGTALVLPSQPGKLSIQKPAVMDMGKPFSVTVSILDRFENTVTDYTGKIALSASDSGAQLPEAYTFTESDLGVKEFSNIIFNEPGSFDLRAADVSGELLGYWSFDEGQGSQVYDLSTNEKHGTVYNGSGAWTSGPPAIQFDNPSAFEFDGARYIVTPEGIDLANQPFTIAFWAKRHTNNGWIVSQGIPETDKGLHIGLLKGVTSYKTKFVMDFYGDGVNYVATEDFGWHHWAVTYDPSSRYQNLYRDGDYLNSCTANGNLQSSGPLLIGMRFDYGGFENYQGSLDDLRVYRQALPQAYIEAMAAGHAEILYAKEVVTITATDNGGLNTNPGNRAITPNMIEFGGDLYVTWAENDHNGHTQIRVKKFNGTTWSNAADTGSLNSNSGNNAYNPVLCEFNGSLYLAWYEDPGSDKVYQVYIRKYAGGTNWNSAVNLSYSNNKAFNVKLKVYDGMLYAVWVENNGTRNQIRAKKTSDESTWSTADDLNNTVNYDPANHVTIPSVEVYDDALYAAWGEKGNIRVKQYDGTSWSTADNGTGLNYNGTKAAHVPVLLNCNSTLYLLWLEENESGIYQVRAKKYNGTAWVEADSGSLNYDQTKGASMLNGFVHNGTIYAAWTEDGRVRIKSCQAAGSTWTSADNGNVNYDAAKASSGLTFGEYQGQLYLSWKEDNGTADQIRLKIY